MVSVPSRGYLFFYRENECFASIEFSFRPLSGLSLFLLFVKLEELRIVSCFRPLSGLSLFLRLSQEPHRIQSYGFRPLSGLSLFLLHPLSPAFFQGFCIDFAGETIRDGIFL